MARVRLVFDRLLATINTLAGESEMPQGAFRDLKNVDIDLTGEFRGRLGGKKVNTASFSGCDSDFTTEADCEAHNGIWIPEAITGDTDCCWVGGLGIASFTPRRLAGYGRYILPADSGSTGTKGCCLFDDGRCIANVSERACYATFPAVAWVQSGRCGEDGCYTTTSTTSSTTTPEATTSTTSTTSGLTTTAAPTTAAPDYCCDGTYDNEDPLMVSVTYECNGEDCDSLEAFELLQHGDDPCLYTGAWASALYGWSLTIEIDEDTGDATYTLAMLVYGSSACELCQDQCTGDSWSTPFDCGDGNVRAKGDPGGAFTCPINGGTAAVVIG